MPFHEENLTRQFSPVQPSKVYSMDNLVDLRNRGKVRALTLVCEINADVDQPLTVQGVCNTLPDPSNGLVAFTPVQVSVPNQHNKFFFHARVDEMALPFYGMTVATGLDVPTSGLVHCYVILWEPD